MSSSINSNAQDLIKELGLSYEKTVADRRDTLAIEVSDGTKHFVLKLHSTDNDALSNSKMRLLQNEARILSSAPHLTNYLYVDHGRKDWGLWLLLRKVEGREAYLEAKQLRQQEDNKGHNKSMLLGLILKISQFYSRLFEGGYLHGDVQPGHTYLEDGEITVIDWGLSCRVEHPNPLYRGGLVYYVAPEIATKMKDGSSRIEYTTAAEVYSIGATLFTIYAGKLPINFGADREKLREMPMAQKIDLVISGNILSFDEVGIPSHMELETILQQCLHTSPARRFSSPIELHKKLLSIKTD